MLLVTNNLPELLDIKEKNILFIGKWCEPLNLLMNNNYHFLDYHWLDREKFQTDHEYLNNLCRNILTNLGEELNRLLELNLNSKFWDIVLNPWLSMFVSGAWDKWEHIRISLSNFDIKRVKILKYKNFVPPLDFNNFIENYFNNQDWNHLIYSEIIKFHKNKKITLEEINTDKELYFLNKVDNKKYIYYFFDILFSLVQRKSKVVFIESNFSKINFIKLSFKLNQFPRFFYQFYKKFNTVAINKDLRSRIIIKINPKNNFEKFIFQIIRNHLPLSYLENFKKIFDHVKKINIDSKIIITANSNFPTEISKIWSAFMHSHKNKKLFLCEHGGSFRLKYRNYEYAEDIFSKKIIWRKPSNNNEYQLPIQRMSHLMNIKSSKKYLTIICMEQTQFAYHAQTIQSSLILEDFNQKKIFIDLIRLSINDYKIKPYKNLGWNLEEKYKLIYGTHKITKKSQLEILKLSKVVVCTYPETSFLESIISGIPTILLFKEEFWEAHSNVSNLLYLLKKNQIIFNCPIQASSHIKKIWPNPNIWWDSKSVIDVRKLFLSECGNIGDNWINEWKNFISSNS